MKRFLGFIKKEFFHIFRDKRTLLILFGMPIVMVLLFGFAISNEINDADIAILDQSRDPVTKELTAKILASGYFQLSEYLDSPDQIEAVFKAGKVKEVIVFAPSFAKTLEEERVAHVQLIADATDPNTGNTLINYTQAILLSFQQEKNKLNAAPVQVNTEVRMRYNPELKSVFLFVPGIITVLLMLVSAMMTSISIAREKELGTMEVLLASPMRPVPILIAKVVPYLLLSFMNAGIILLLGYFVFGVPVQGSITLLLLETVLFIFTALSLGIMISTIADTQQVALLISLFALMLPTIMLSGFVFPIENMPMFLQVISNAIPAKWFIIILKAIMLKGAGIGLLWKETAIMVGFIAFFIAVSAKKFKIRLG